MKPLDILKKYWGFDAFRPLQEDIIQSVLDGNDTLALMPTGGGKSLCFQVPALCQEGICIVVSPLIALMKDQVEALQKKKIPAVAIFSGMHPKEIDRILDNCAYGNTKFLYLSPERLTTDLAKERIKKMNVNLLAVDEAHCISQWGYDFRPSYLLIAEARSLMPNVPVLALTATATGEVVKDIQEKLEFRKQHIFQKSFARDNLAYVVLPEENKMAKMLDIVKNVKGSGVVYARNRKMTEQAARFLQQNNISADFYHAGLPPNQRSAKQEAWLNNKIRIMACTNAFGMGIDKPDVRSVVHLDLPESLEAYFQEAGRGGRDGKKSYAVLLYANVDRAMLERNIEISFPPISEIKRVYGALGSYFQLAVGSGEGRSFDFDIADFSKNFQFQPLMAYACLKILEQSGWLTLSEAIHLPSSFLVKVQREQLYDFQLKNPGKIDTVIKTLLRVTEGAFFHFSNINESQLSKFLKMERAEFIAILQQLEKEGILTYRPAKDMPQLYFTMERVAMENMTIEEAAYKFRKERYIERIAKAVAYAETPKCRSQQLLAYFGEKIEPCDVCDVCLGRTKSELTQEDFDRYKLKISQLLMRDKLSEKQIIESFASNRQPLVVKVLEFLIDEGLVEKEKEKLVWKG